MMFVIRYILTVLYKNPGKILFFSAAIGCLYMFLSFGNVTDNLEFDYVYEFMHDGKCRYIGYDDGYSVQTPDVNDVIVSNADGGGTILYTDTRWNGWKIVGLIFMCAFALVGFLIPLHDSDEWRWDFWDIYDDLLMKEVKMNEEAGIYYYHYKGRLLSSSERKLSAYQLRDNLKECKKYPNLYEKIEVSISKDRKKRIKKVERALA